MSPCNILPRAGDAAGQDVYSGLKPWQRCSFGRGTAWSHSAPQPTAPNMIRRFPPSPLLLALGMLVLVACAGREGTPTPGVTATLTPTATVTPSLVQTPSIPPSLTPNPTPTRIAVAGTTATAQTPTGNSSLSEGNPTVLMKAALAYLTEPPFDDSFIHRMGESGDTSFVPVLVDLLFFRFVTPRPTTTPSRLALTKLTGENFADPSWPDWFAWLGRHREIEAPPLYAEFKSQLYQRVDPGSPCFSTMGSRRASG